MKKHKRLRIVVLAMGSMTLGGILLSGCLQQNQNQNPTTQPQTNNQAAQTKATYVGEKTCITCHSDVGNSFMTTSHANDFKSLSAYTLDKDYSVKLFDAENKDKAVSADVKIAPDTTVGVMMDHYIIAKAPSGFKEKYYRIGALKKLDNGKYSISPATTGDFDKDGKSDDWGASDYSCSSCHSPGLAAGTEDVGMTCESCHGPGSNHITATQKKGSYPITARTCLTCHPLEPAKDATTGAIQAQNHYGTRGFYASKHYTSQQVNSCLTCHDPHKANQSGMMLLKDQPLDICKTCHANLDQNTFNSIFWKNPVDPHGHTTADHSFLNIKLSDYTIDQKAKTMTLNNNMVNKLKSLFPDLFNPSSSTGTAQTTDK